MKRRAGRSWGSERATAIESIVLLIGLAGLIPLLALASLLLGAARLWRRAARDRALGHR